MRYRLPGGTILRAENAAKPASQRSEYLDAIIRGLPPVESSVDYGCGKLRYLNAMLETSERVDLVDSEVQLARLQILDGSKTTIRSLIGSSNRISAFNTVEFASQVGGYDRGFCINVLSAIPYSFARRNALRLLRHSLRQGAECLFVVQYRNSDFTRMASLPYARKWQDGILLKSWRGSSFYALISPERLTIMVRNAGFDIANVHLNDGSIYLWGRAQRQLQRDVTVFDEDNSFRCKLHCAIELGTEFSS